MTAIRRHCYSLLSLMLLVLLGSACNSAQPMEPTEHQKRNESLIEKIATDQTYTASDFEGMSSHKYYYKVLEEAPADAERPLQNSVVKVELSQSLALTNQVVIPMGELTLTIFKISNGRPDGQVKGLQYVLQEMRVGERREVILPWQLSYGAYAMGVIPAYSALKYDIKLVEIEQL